MESKIKAELIWSTLNTIENSDKSREEQIKIITPILDQLIKDSVKRGALKAIDSIHHDVLILKSKFK